MPRANLTRSSVAGGLVLLLTTCTNTPTASTSKNYSVAYRLTVSPGIMFDSVKYEDAQGAVVKVVAPRQIGAWDSQHRAAVTFRRRRGQSLPQAGRQPL